MLDKLHNYLWSLACTTACILSGSWACAVLSLVVLSVDQNDLFFKHFSKFWTCAKSISQKRGTAQACGVLARIVADWMCVSDAYVNWVSLVLPLTSVSRLIMSSDHCWMSTFLRNLVLMWLQSPGVTTFHLCLHWRLTSLQRRLLSMISFFLLEVRVIFIFYMLWISTELPSSNQVGLVCLSVYLIHSLMFAL